MIGKISHKMIKIFVLVTKTEREILHIETYTNKVHNVLTKNNQKEERKGDTNRILDVLSAFGL